MTATNHAITGALIAAISPVAVVAVPLAFMSHFALDNVPHFGVKKHTIFWSIFVTDAFLATIFLLELLSHKPTHWPLLIICAMVAMSPDLMWISRRRRDLDPSTDDMHSIVRFHKHIQREYPWAMGIELIWLMSFLYIFIHIER